MWSLSSTNNTIDRAMSPQPAPKNRANRRTKKVNLQVARNSVQLLVCLVLLYVGWQFFLFVRHFETDGAASFVARPPLVEGFLPISGLVGLKSLIVNGTFDPVHPAGLVIFATILGISLLFKKAFCSWFCPVGTLFEWTWRFGRRILGRNLSLPRFLDYPLMAIKYVILAFFVKTIVLDMSGADLAAFIESPYNKVVDVKMLYFFTKMGTGMALFLLALLAISAVVKNFWCRYLCPYGALLGLVTIISPITVTRDTEKCTDCKLCTRVCPNRIDVARAASVESPECTSCLSCVKACPTRGALELRVFRRRPINAWSYAAMLIATVAMVFVIAKLTGHWDTSLTYADWSKLIPQVESLSHF